MFLGTLIINHPLVSLVITIALGISMTRSASLLRETATTKAPSWLVVALVLWIIFAASAVILIFPRTLRAAPIEARVAVQWAGAVGIYLMAFVTWTFYGIPTWVLVLSAVTAVTLLVVVVSSIRSVKSS